jgi:uncharacterized membrane protein YobD (UPF0266 family)
MEKLKELRIFKKEGFFFCELWIENSNLRNDGYFFDDMVKASSFSDLLVEIGNKNWIDLLNKN